MYTILFETDEATGVNLSVSGQFLPGKGRQLVTVAAKTLKVYRLNPYGIVKDDDDKYSQITKLECILTFTLIAAPRFLSSAKIPLSPNCDCLVMSFDDAKLSIVNINPKTMTLNTLSLHSIEDEFLRDGYKKDVFSPDLCIDPEQRCAVFLVYGRHLGIVSFLETKDQHLQSYSVPLRSFDEKLDNIVDMTFLDGYYEPTLLFLYEPIKTTAGRASIRYDTLSILGVSLNVKDKVHAVVWNFTGLPMTVFKCLQIPSPIGGICLFGANEIIYLNQSVPPCGIALNSCAEDFTKFPLNDFKHLKMTLDGCVVYCENANHIFVVSRSGDFYVLTLLIDYANTVKNLKLEKVFTATIPCTLTLCSPGHLFLGSRLGDSLLLHYSCQRIFDNDNIKNNHENHLKKISSLSDIVTFDDEDLFLYGSEIDDINDTKYENNLYEYKFCILDKIVNVGPCKILRTCAVNDLNFAKRKRAAKNILFNLVTVSGHEHESSLCFFERTIRPIIIKSTVLPDAVQFWSVGKRKDDSNRYLIIAREFNTIVLERENTMIEVDKPIFLTSETTIAAGELDNGRIVVQVTSISIVLVANDQQIQMINIDSNFPVIMASIVDPFIVLLTQNGKIILYKLGLNPILCINNVPILSRLLHEKSPVTSVCVYKDISGIIQFNKNQTDNEIVLTNIHQGQKINKTELDNSFVKKEEIIDEDFQQSANDEIDDYLYNYNKKKELKKSFDKKIMFNGNQSPDDCLLRKENYIETNVQDPNHVQTMYYLCMARETGHLYIYSLPEMKLVYIVKKFNQLPDVLHDDIGLSIEDDQVQQMQQAHSAGLNLQNVTTDNTKNGQDATVLVKPEEIVMELQLFGMGINQSRPILSALIDDTVIFYEMFYCDEGVNAYNGHLSIRFRRLNCYTVTRSGRFMGPNGRAAVEAARDVERHRPLIHTFEKIGKFTAGFFIAGGYPSMFIMERGEPRLHPMTINGPISSFTSFNNANCRNGFLFLAREDHVMNVALLPFDINYDASYPFRKIQLNTSVHYVTYLLQQQVYGVITSVKQTFTKQCTLINEDKQFETFEREENFVLPTINLFTLRLFSTENWSFVPDTEFNFDEFEIVTCMEEVLLSSESTVAGVQSYLAVGTAYNYGEEVFVRGRVILCEIIDVVPEEGLPTSRHKLKVVYDKEQKGPVTSMCSSNGYLVTGMGQKVFIWQFRDGELHGVSFLDMHFYVHHLVAFRNLAVACDLYRSLTLIRYQEEFKALSFVSRDLRPTAPPPMAANFLIDNKQLGFVLSDEEGNVTIFSYIPDLKESIGGERLIIRAVINIGSFINSFVRVKGHVDEYLIENEVQARESHTCMFATLDGSFGFVRPILEKVFRRLLMLQQVIVLHISQPAGLNPRGARAPRPAHTDTNQQLSFAKNCLDGNLLFPYLYLGTQDKTDLARKLGTSRYQIMDDLLECLRVTTHY